jgi:hypothetical protein
LKEGGLRKIVFSGIAISFILPFGLIP